MVKRVTDAERGAALAGLKGWMLVDGREAVSFLKTIKDVIEDPSRLFLEI